MFNLQINTHSLAQFFFWSFNEDIDFHTNTVTVDICWLNKTHTHTIDNNTLIVFTDLVLAKKMKTIDKADLIFFQLKITELFDFNAAQR